MLKFARWRVLLVVIGSLWALAFAAPNLIPQSVRNSLPAFAPKQTVNLGLDLRGGSYMLLEANLTALQKERLESELDNMSKTLQDARPRIGYTGRGVSGGAARLKVLNPADQDRAVSALKALHAPTTAALISGGAADPDFTVVVAPDGYIEARLTKTGADKLSADAITRSIEVVRRRVDEMGTNEVSITRQGTDRINVQAPGVSDPQQLKDRIGKTAKMTFHMHDASVSAADLAAGRAPPGTTILPQENASEPFVAIRTRAVLTGDDLTDAQPAFDPQTSEPVVSFRFNQRGARIFCQVTTENIGRRFAIVLDGKVLTAPNVLGAICGGSGQISGNFTVVSATELSTLLRAGALPVPLSIVEQRTVGAELGQDSINAGVTAGVVATVLVIAFMVLAYGFFGVMACLALVVNIAMIIAAMSVFGATLSLPGIAGLILTIGMAVDANVLVYERMREEQANGRGPAMAIDAGFHRALVTIIDSHLTQILAALILFQFGHGPVRGFAWTLSIGCITSVFTATLVTQYFIFLWFRATRPKKLPI